MWALPARSMPGSEMLFVENTRIRGTKRARCCGSVATGAVMDAGLLRGGVVAAIAERARRDDMKGCAYLRRVTNTRS